MQRITTSTRAVDLFGPGKDGFKDGDLANGIVPTDLNAAMFNGLQEEVLAPVEGVGLAPNGGDLGQLFKAIRRISGGNHRALTASAALTADDAGVVVIDATAGPVTVTLPAGNAMGTRPIRFVFRRTDGASNAVTIQRAGADTIDGATSVTMLGAQDQRELISNGGSVWLSIRGPYSRGGSWQRLPSGLLVQWGTVNVNTNSATSPGYFGSTAVTYPIAFSATPAIVGMVPQDAVGSVPYAPSWFNNSASGFTAYMHSANNGQGWNVNWLAFGN